MERRFRRSRRTCLIERVVNYAPIVIVGGCVLTECSTLREVNVAESPPVTGTERDKLATDLKKRYSRGVHSGAGARDGRVATGSSAAFSPRPVWPCAGGVAPPGRQWRSQPVNGHDTAFSPLAYSVRERGRTTVSLKNYGDARSRFHDSARFPHGPERHQAEDQSREPSAGSRATRGPTGCSWGSSCSPDACVTVVNPLLLRQLIDNGIIAKNEAVVGGRGDCHGGRAVATRSSGW